MSLINNGMPLNSNHFTSNNNSSIPFNIKRTTCDTESLKNMPQSSTKNYDNKRKEYKTFVTLAKERKAKIYDNKNENHNSGPSDNEIQSSMIIKSINGQFLPDFAQMRTTHKKGFQTPFILEHNNEALSATKNGFDKINVFPDLKEKINPNVINIVPGIRSVNGIVAPTIDPDFFLKHSERFPNKNNLINFNTNPGLNKTIKGSWKKNINSNFKDNNSSEQFQRSLYYSNAFNKFYPESTKAQKSNLNFIQLSSNRPQQDNSNMNIKRMGISRSNLKEIIKIKSDILELYKEYNSYEKYDKNMSQFNSMKQTYEKSIEDFLDRDEKNVLGYNFDNKKRFNTNPKKLPNRKISKKHDFVRGFQKFATEIPTINKKKKIKYTPIMNFVSEHLLENKNSKDLDNLNRRMEFQDKKILQVLKKINPSKEDVNKIFINKLQNNYFN